MIEQISSRYILILLVFAIVTFAAIASTADFHFLLIGTWLATYALILLLPHACLLAAFRPRLKPGIAVAIPTTFIALFLLFCFWPRGFLSAALITYLVMSVTSLMIFAFTLEGGWLRKLLLSLAYVVLNPISFLMYRSRLKADAGKLAL